MSALVADIRWRDGEGSAQCRFDSSTLGHPNGGNRRISPNVIALAKVLTNSGRSARTAGTGLHARHCKAVYAGPRPCRRALTDRVVDSTPAPDGFDVSVHRREVRAHRHDRYVAAPSFAPSRNIARPLVVPATVLLDRLEAECIGV